MTLLATVALTIGCPEQIWPIQVAAWTGGFVWLLGLGVLTVVAWERAQDWARRDGEGP